MEKHDIYFPEPKADLPRPTKVFYRPEMTADTTSFSPSAAKPKLAVQDWALAGLLREEDLVYDFPPATVAELCMAHRRPYVEGVLAGEIANGFGNTDASVAASLPYTVGSMIAAARYAVRNEGGVVCSPTSGFHHAHHGRASGFCTFNGLMVAALALKAEGAVDSVAIIDCDYHYGDGTADIIDELGVTWVTHRTMGAESFAGSTEREKSASFFEWLERSIDLANKCDLVLYQAGADASKHDPLGGLLGDTLMAERDKLVLGGIGRPLVWNLAGGYRTLPGEADPARRLLPVLQLHRQTMLASTGVNL